MRSTSVLKKAFFCVCPEKVNADAHKIHVSKSACLFASSLHVNTQVV